MPWDEFNVVVFQRLCMQAVEEIYERGHVPILTGGTGFYIQSVLYGIDFTQTEEDTGYRESLETLAKEKGTAILHEMLKEVDPVSAETIHVNNVKRVIRALEFYRQTGTRISEHNEKERQKESAFTSCYFVLNDERSRLYEKIDNRVDEMLQQGLVEEVRHLMELGCRKDMVSMQGLGYKEMISYLSGECSLDEAVYQIKRDTRHFAKRQLTWFKREKDVIWVNKPDFDENRILAFMLNQFNEQRLYADGKGKRKWN